jgi:hypothetical protein
VAAPVAVLQADPSDALHFKGRFAVGWPRFHGLHRRSDIVPAARIKNPVAASATGFEKRFSNFFYLSRECKLLIKLNPPQLCSPKRGSNNGI